MAENSRPCSFYSGLYREDVGVFRDDKCEFHVMELPQKETRLDDNVIHYTKNPLWS